MGIEHQLKKVKIPGLSALALSACLTFLKPVLNLQNSRPIGRVLLSKIQSVVFYKARSSCPGLRRQ